MCGIAGIIAQKQSSAVPVPSLESMTRALAHRGPDGEGFWLDPSRRVGFGHRRLSIIDLSDAGRQPMETAEGDLCITFNGEIYNFVQLRRELEQMGSVFRSRTDTEVLLHLYRRHGEAMLQKLEGDFAFAIHDVQSRKTFLARDRAGVKPLYYAESGGFFVFASELRAVLASELVRRDVDPRALYHYLSFLCAPPGASLVAGVQKLEPGCSLTIDAEGRVIRKRYWDALPQRAAKTDARKLDDEFAALFSDAVSKRMIADVPVGVLFSGGVDSTLNAAMFRDLAGAGRIDTFTATLPGAAQDEGAEAAKMAAHLGTRHHEARVTPRDVMHLLPEIIRGQDEPLSDPVCLPLYMVSALARQTGVTVLQAGEGADELFCGYPAYLKQMRAEKFLWRPLSLLPRGMAAAAGGAVAARAKNPLMTAVADALSRRGAGQEFFMSSAIAFYDVEKSAVLSPGMKEATTDDSAFDAVRGLYRRLADDAPDADPLQVMTYLELNLRLPELLLQRVDRMSMAHGLEVRVPFLDHRVIEFAMRAPSAWKLAPDAAQRKHGRIVGKAPVKRLAARYAPEDAVYRRKQGFAAPIRNWLPGPWRPWAEDVLRRPESAEFFDSQALLAKLDDPRLTTREAFQLWTVLNFLSWKSAVLDNS